jgi:hypothetical protein
VYFGDSKKSEGTPNAYSGANSVLGGAGAFVQPAVHNSAEDYAIIEDDGQLPF